MRNVLCSLLFLMPLIPIIDCSPRAEEKVAIVETDQGSISIRLFDRAAPKHVENFMRLSRQGFYNGTTFHRIARGDFIQGGDPNTRDDDPWNDGTGGAGYTIEAEFNPLKHHRGTVSMARKREKDSAGSQFFICLKDLPDFDGLFTVFGEVIEGMDVVDRIASSPVDSSGTPMDAVCLRKVRIESRPVR